MAGLPSDRPIPGTPLLDPLTGEPIVATGPQPVAPWAAQFPAAQLAQAAPDWPPAAWGQDQQGPAAPAPDSNQVPEDQALAAQPAQPAAPAGAPSTDNPAPPSDLPPPSVPPAPSDPTAGGVPATQLAGPQGMAALDQAHADGGNQPIDPYTKDQHPGPPITPEQQYYNHVDESARKQKAAVAMEANAEIQKNTAEAQQSLELAQSMQRKQAQADAMYMGTYKAAKAKRDQLDKEAMDIASTKIDPRRVWHDMSFGAKLATGIMAALAATSRSAPVGAPNPVIAMLNGMAEQDVAAQKESLETRGSMLTQRRGLLADDLTAGRDMLDIQYKSQKAAYEMGKNAIQAYCLQYDNQVITAKGILQQNAIDDAAWEAHNTYLVKAHKQLMDDSELRLKWVTEGDRVRNEEANRQNALEIAGLRGEGARQKAAQGDRESQLLDPEGKPIPLNDGSGDVARIGDPKKADEARMLMTAKFDYWQSLGRYKDFLVKNGTVRGGAGPVAGSDAYSKAEQMHANLINKYNRVNSIKRLSGEDVSLVGGKDIPGPDTWLHGSNPIPAVQSAQDDFEHELNQEMQSVWRVNDPDWVGTYKATHPKAFDSGSTDSDDRRTWDVDPVSTDKTGKRVDPRFSDKSIQEAEKRQAAQIKRSPAEARKLSPPEEMDRLYGTHQAAPAPEPERAPIFQEDIEAQNRKAIEEEAKKSKKKHK